MKPQQLSMNLTIKKSIAKAAWGVALLNLASFVSPVFADTNNPVWKMGKSEAAWSAVNFATSSAQNFSTTFLADKRNGTLTSPLLSLPANNYHYAEIYYYYTGVPNTIHLLFSPEKDENYTSNVYTDTVLPQEKYRPGKLIIPLNGNENWQGEIKRLRLQLPSRNDGAKFTLLGVTLRSKHDWLENGTFAAIQENGLPWDWQQNSPRGSFNASVQADGWEFTANRTGRMEVETAIPHIRQGYRYNLNVDYAPGAPVNAHARFRDMNDKLVANLPLQANGAGKLQLNYEVPETWASGQLVVTAQARRSGDKILLRQANLENLGSKNRWKAEWIWPSSTPQNEQSSIFRHTFDIQSPADYSTALLQITADDQFGVWINGTRAAAHNMWAEPRAVDVLHLLKPGRNIIYVRAYNRGGQAGMLAELRLDRKDGKPAEFIYTNDQWLSTHENIVSGERADYQLNPAQWNRPHSFGKPPVNPWSNLPLHEALPPKIQQKEFPRETIASEQLVAKINTELNYPRLELNGKIQKPFFFGTPANGDRTQSMINARQGDFNLYRIWWEMGDAWRQDGTLDLASLDRVVEEHLLYNPNARMLLGFRITAPSWWMAKYPEELCRYSDGTVNGHYGLLPSMASERWLGDVEKCLEQLINHIEKSWYKSRIIGYMPSSHSGPEWVMTTKQAEIPDYSEPMLAYYRDFLRKKYQNNLSLLREKWGNPEVTFETAAVPLAQRRSPTDRWILNEKSEADVIDYNRAINDATGDAIMRVMRKIRQLAPQKLTTIYYGYTLTLAQLGFYPQLTGHYDVERVLGSGLVDIFASPVSYFQREPGDISGIGALQDTFRKHNVVWLQEADNRSSLTVDSFSHKFNFNLQAAAMENRREFIYALTNRLGLWFYDMTGGWYDNPIYTRDFQKMQQLYDAAFEKPIGYRAPIAVFYDETSLDVISTSIGNYSSNAPRTLLYDFQRGLAQSGQPYDLLTTNDLKDIATDQYRILVFPATFRYDTALIKQLKERFADSDIAIVFLGIPGRSGEGVEQASELVGMQLAPVNSPTDLTYTLQLDSTPAIKTGLAGIKPPEAMQVVDSNAQVLGRYADNTVAAAAKKLPGGSTRYFMASPDNSGTFWRWLLQKQGVAPLIDRNDRVVFDGTNLGIIALDAPGKRTIKLPVKRGSVIDAFSGKVIAADARQFTVELMPGESVLYQVR